VKVLEFRNEVHNLGYTAEVNQRYHQIKQRRMWLWDKWVKIGVALLALFALLAVFLPHEWKCLEVVAAVAATVAAVVLNVVPVGEWVTEFGEMFRSWSDLLLAVEQLELKARNFEEDAAIPDHLVERLAELVSHQCQLDAMEPAPDDALLSRCQGDINQRTYGKGVRTHEQVMARLRQTEEEGIGHA
jgi:hypothetical protein